MVAHWHTDTRKGELPAATRNAQENIERILSSDVIGNEAAFRATFRPEALVEMYIKYGTQPNKALGSAAIHRLSADKQK
jgi:hypothetical protein